jgi:DNA-binding MarR family transcriptional regulator
MQKLANKNNAIPNGGDRLLADADLLRELPAFPEAVREYTVGLARFREAPRLINKLISYETRFRVTGYLLYLHADREMFGPDGGATYGRLFELCTRRREVSPRVLKTTLAMLKLAGFVETRRSDIDRRSKFYRPTARMYEFIREWQTYAVNALDVLQPEMRRAQMLQNDPHFVERFLVAGGREHIAGEPPADRMPDFIGFFGRREGAAAVILAVMLADIDREPLPSRAHIAKRFGLSKTQVSNIIGEGVRLGFLALDDAGVPSATQYLRDGYGRWISIELAFYAQHMLPAQSLTPAQ